MIIDAHLHIWQADPAFPNPQVTTVSPMCDIPESLLRDYMAEHGVERAVLVQPVYPGEDNSLVADAAANDPQRFAAVCVVDPNRDGAAERLQYWVRERGCRGLRLRPSLAAEEEIFGHPRSFALWQKAAELGIAINVMGRAKHLPRVGELAARFATVPILIDHMAHPDPSAGVDGAGFQDLLALARHANVSIKPTGFNYYSQQGYPYDDCHVLVRAVYDSFGPRRIIWGSDFPHVILSTLYSRALALPRAAYDWMTEDDFKLLLGGNAERVYWGG